MGDSHKNFNNLHQDRFSELISSFSIYILGGKEGTLQLGSLPEFQRLGRTVD